MKNKLLIILLFTLLTQHTLHSQWFQQQIPVNKPISGIKFIDSLKGWAATSWGSSQDTSYVINTTNGGNSWNIQLRFGIGFFEAFTMIDANTGYVGGYSPLPGPGPLMFKTTNGGLNWINKGAPSGPTDLFFINRDTGWYCNNAFAADIRTTTNGGNTWQLRVSGLIDNVERVFFLNYFTGFCGSTYFNKTTNGGITWNRIYDFTTGIYSIFFINEQTGWVGLNNNRIRYTTNGGLSWIAQTISPPSGTVHELFFINYNLGWAGFLMDYIFKTYNSGNNWGYQFDSTGSKRFSFTDSLHGWSGYLGTGKISRTTNGGGIIIYNGIVNNSNEIPRHYMLYQNYPNPFNSQTTIKFSITKTSYVLLKIYDILGKEKTIWNSDKMLPTGTHELSFDAQDLSSGVYFYQLISSDDNGSIKFNETKKMILVK